MSYYEIGGQGALIGEDDDLIGDYLEIAGDDVSDMLEVGAQRPRVNRMAMALAHNKAMLRTRGPTKARYFPLGVPATTIAAGLASTITVRPQVPFRPQRFIVPSDIAGAFTIGDIRVGKNSQFVTADAVPARAFQEDASTGIEFGFDTAQVSQDISVVANNISAAQQVFRAIFMGQAVE